MISFLNNKPYAACIPDCDTGYSCVSDQCCPDSSSTSSTATTTVATTTSTCQNIASNCASLSYLCNNATYYVCCSLLIFYELFMTKYYLDLDDPKLCIHLRKMFFFFIINILHNLYVLLQLQYFTGIYRRRSRKFSNRSQ